MTFASLQFQTSPYGYQHDYYTPELVTELPDDCIFVFGSNPEGRHGKGAALVARQRFGAKYGQAEGLQGRSYGIITKELRRHYPPVTLAQVRAGIEGMMVFAANNDFLGFYVTKIGCNLAYFSEKQIGDIFRELMPLMPPNVILPKEFV